MYRAITGWALIRNAKTRHILIAKPSGKWHLEEQVVDVSIKRVTYEYESFM
jgi:hypothetical protein